MGYEPTRARAVASRAHVTANLAEKKKTYIFKVATTSLILILSKTLEYKFGEIIIIYPVQFQRSYDHKTKRKLAKKVKYSTQYLFVEDKRENSGITRIRKQNAKFEKKK